MNYSREKWIAVIVAILVVGIFFWGMFAYQQQTNNSAQLTTNTMTDNSTSTPTSAPQTMPDGLISQDIVTGTGAEAKAGSSVTVNYVGALQDGTIFDSTASHNNQPFNFTIGAGKVIPGWEEGVSGMKVGGKRRLIIPPSLAYGAQGAGNGVIPPNATLIFEIELLQVK